MKKLYTLFFGLLLFSNIAMAQKQWSVVSSNNSIFSPHYYDVANSTSNIWHVCGEDGIIKLSDNYGKTWVDASQGINNTHRINTIEFVSSQLGFAGGVTTTLQFGNFGKLYYTIDGGKNWIDYNTSSTLPRVNAIHFPSFYRGYAVANNRVLRAVNAGSTWSYVYTYGSIDLYDIHFADSMFGMACGELGSIIRTDDGGQVFQTVYNGPNGTDPDIFGIHLLSKNIAIACGENGLLVRTDNGGQDWTEYNVNTSRDFKSIHFFNNQEGIVVGEGIILYTSNGGASFSSLPTPTSKELNSVVMLNSNQAIAVGNNETILKYGTLGVSVKEIKPLDNNTIRVYPNPASNKVNIRMKEGLGANSTVYISNIAGKLIHKSSFNFTQGTAEINTSSYTPGVYTIRVQSAEGVYNQQLVIN